MFRPSLGRLIESGRLDWIRSPTAGLPIGSADGAQANRHGECDDDCAVVAATVTRILDRSHVDLRLELHRSET